MECPNCGHRFQEEKNELFETFWKAYPRKAGKGAAQKVWNRIKGVSYILGDMLNAIETQKKSIQWNKDNGVYIPHPATWLNQKRWLDEEAQKAEIPTVDSERMAERKRELALLAEKEWNRRRGVQA